MKLVVKVGGAQLSQAAARATFARSVSHALAAGHRVIVVHGGGEQLRTLTDRLGLGAPQKVRGLRVTDAATAEAATMVLGGSVNRTLVRVLGAAGVRAVGLTGADGNLFDARPIAAELGFVGVPMRVDPTILFELTNASTVPVVASIAPLASNCDGDSETFYNINADQVVAPLARAFGADAVLFLTDVEGVRDSDGARLAALDAHGIATRIESGVIAGGMIPKVEAALAAAQTCPQALVKIAPADTEDAVRNALDSNVGTAFSTGEQEATPHG